MVYGTVFLVLLVALRAPSQLGPEGDVDTGPHIARVSAPPGKVDPPAGGSSGEGRAVSEKGSRRIIEQGVPRSRGLRHVVLSLRLGGESLHLSRGSYRLRLSLSPGGVYTGNMAELDCIEGRGRGCGEGQDRLRVCGRGLCDKLLVDEQPK